MNVLLLDQYGEMGGGQRVFLQIVKALTTAGHKMTVAFPRQGSLYSALQHQTKLGLDYVDLPQLRRGSGGKGPGYLARLMLFTLNIISELWPVVRHTDIIYANGPQHFIAVAFLSLLTRTPAVYHIHMVYGQLGWILISLISMLPTTKHIVLCSDFTHRRAQEANIILRRCAKLVVVENSLSAEVANTPYTNRYRNGAGKAVLILGRICPAKGQDIAIKIARNLPGNLFHIVGPVFTADQPWYSDLRAEAPPNVKFHPENNQIDRFITQNDIGIFLVPSQCDEAFGLVIIEAAALSCIPIASARGGLSGLSECLASPTFATESEAIIQIANFAKMEPEALAAKTKQFHARAKSKYNPKRFSAEIEKIVGPALK